LISGGKSAAVCGLDLRLKLKFFLRLFRLLFFRSQFHGAQTFGFFLRQEKISDIFFPEKKGHAILRIRGIASINKGH